MSEYIWFMHLCMDGHSCARTCTCICGARGGSQVLPFVVRDWSLTKLGAYSLTRLLG